MDIAKVISKSLSERLVIAKVDGTLWDLERPLEKSCKLELLDFEHPEGICHATKLWSMLLASVLTLSSIERQEGVLALFRARPWRGL